MTTSSSLRVAFFVYAAHKNTLGRAYSLWLTSQALGLESRFVASSGDGPWSPLAGEHRFLAQLTSAAEDAAAWADMLVALKPWPGSFDTALRLGARWGKPVGLDVDDPDWEGWYGESLRRQALNFAVLTGRGRPPIHAYRLRRRARSIKRMMVSNPALHRWYGNRAVVPHARLPRPPAERAEANEIGVAFVGTVAAHKGVEVLRRAAAAAGVARLTLTADPPGGTPPHERWVGQTSLAEGLDLIESSDVVAIPSLPYTYGIGQLPVKLIDAMMAGRAIVASDVEPIRWALAGSGMLVAPGDTEALAHALRRLRSPALRAELGAQARARALARFTPEATAPDLAAALGC